MGSKIDSEASANYEITLQSTTVKVLHNWYLESDFCDDLPSNVLNTRRKEYCGASRGIY